MSFVSAGLCRGSDGYYHDCDDFSDRYYENNFYPNYETEYYKETSESSTSILSIKESRNSYEEISADSYAESNIEIIKKERDYSYPKTRYNDYGRKDYTHYEKEDKPLLIIFINQPRPAYNKNININVDKSYWRYKEPYNAKDYKNAQYNDYYYKPRYDYGIQQYNWRW